MTTYYLEWLNLFVRWFHMIAGVAWIGASFYFVFLDQSLRPAEKQSDKDQGVAGEIWSVHGGGFYHAQKYRVAPQTLPSTLHWFKWEAYSTWLSGMFLLGLIYWYSAEIYLIDPSVPGLTKPIAIAISILMIAGGWIIYDLLCKSPIAGNRRVFSFLLCLLVSVAAWGVCQLYSGRGAFIIFGAMLGTIMVANVFFVIIPGQKELVAAKQAGCQPDPTHGIRGHQRSVHNTYFTLPVLFVMISNHYAFVYGHAYNWLILIVVALSGALIRIYFVSRHRDGRANYVAVVTAVVLLIGLVLLSKPNMSDTANKADRVPLAEVQSIISKRCSSCHASTPSQPGFIAAPKGIMYDTPEQIVAQGSLIYQQAVVTRVMPPGNLTAITDDERAAIAVWYEGQ